MFKLSPGFISKALPRLVNLGIKAVTLGSRFAFIFFLARYVDASVLGLYGLLTATMGYIAYLIGFDFYTFSTREMLKVDRSLWGGMLKSQMALYGLAYLTILPLVFIFFALGFLPVEYFGWFAVVLVLEHFNQELCRLLIAVSRPVVANIVLFVRQASWALAVIALMMVDEDLRNLQFIFAAWAVAGVVSVILAMCYLKTSGFSGWKLKVQWSWIRRGMRICVPLLFATLAIRAVFTVDRYWLQSISGIEVVGAYVLFAGIVGVLMSFLDTGVFTFFYPAMIGSSNKEEPEKFSRLVSGMFLQTVAFCVVFVLASSFLIAPVISWTGNSFYLEKLYLFYWLLGATVLYALSMVPHYALYARGIDRPIVLSHLISVIVFAMVTWAATLFIPSIAVPLGVCCTFLFILLWKTVCFFKLIPIEYRRFNLK